MRLRAFARLSRSGGRLIWGGALLALLAAAGTTAIGDVTEEAKRAGNQRDDSFSLFSGPTAVLTGNQLQCGLVNQGEVCKDVFDSPTGNGGFWPTGSPNGYIFNTGLQIAGVIGADGGPWANDTVAGYFFDARGNQRSGTPLTDIFVSTDANDFANWPDEAVVNDADLFNPVLLGRKAASQEDSWVKYWEGDPVRITNRQHPMGIQATQRSLAWGFPSGNESVLYFIYNFQNVSADANFQQLNELAFFGGDNQLPDAGYTLNELFAAFSTDMDVTVNAGENFSTAILPFDIGLSYHGGFLAADFLYPPDLFRPPFFTDAPGLIGVKYLKSPINPETGQEVGLTLFSNTQNPSSPGAQFIDPLGDKQLWRYLSGRLDPAQGDPPCNVTPEIETGDPSTTQRSLCFIFQQAADTRFFQSSGPFSIAPGDIGTIVVAYIAAATVNTPDITTNATPNTNPPGVPSFHSGFDSARGCDANGQNCTSVVPAAANLPLPIEKGAGWISYVGSDNPDAVETPANKLNQFDVTVVPGSLLGKALVAQTIFDNKFLLGFAPEPPPFRLIPGDENVTIIWEDTPTEVEGDPFFQVASDPESPLFNPNYREFDVEGYRVWRGQDPGTLSLLAQFDKSDSEYTDNICETVPPDEDIGNAAGIGYAAGETCPGVLTRPINSSMIFNNGSDGGPPGGGVVRSAGGAAVAVNLTTVITDDPAGPSEAATDTGIPFAFVDNTVANNFTYFYAVSAFDVNSQASGPHSLRSTRPAVSIVPRKFSTNIEQPFAFSVAVAGDDGEPLDVTASTLQPDAATGIFSGPQPPTNAAEVFTIPDPSAAGPLLAPGTVSITIDSIVPLSSGNNPCPLGSNARGMCWKIYTTADNGAGTVAEGVVDGMTPFSGVTFEETDYAGPLGGTVVPFSDEELARYGIEAGFGAGVTVGVRATWTTAITNSAAEALQCRFDEATADCEPGGSRWFDGDTETLEHPTVFTQAGALAGVDSIYHPISHTNLGDGSIAPASGDMVCFPYTMSFMGRAADVRFTWTGGTFSEVRDLTHHVNVPFAPLSRASWGFMNTDANGNGMIDWQDFDYIDGINQNTEAGAGPLNFFCALGDRGIVNPPVASFDNTPQFQPTSTQGVQPETTVATGTGFGLYVNGEHYIFEMSAPPADGTVWTLRTYFGYMEADDAQTAAPSNYTLLPASAGDATENRPTMVTGLSYVVDITEAGTVTAGKDDLTQVHTVPDPYLSTSQFDLSPTSKEIAFVNLPAKATIRIYTLTGVLVDIVEHDDFSGGGRAVWNVRNRNNQFVGSGVYFFHVQTPSGDEYVGKFTVINFGGQN